MKQFKTFQSLGFRQYTSRKQIYGQKQVLLRVHHDIDEFVKKYEIHYEGYHVRNPSFPVMTPKELIAMLTLDKTNEFMATSTINMIETERYKTIEQLGLIFGAVLFIVLAWYNGPWWVVWLNKVFNK